MTTFSASSHHDSFHYAHSIRNPSLHSSPVPLVPVRRIPQSVPSLTVFDGEERRSTKSASTTLPAKLSQANSLVLSHVTREKILALMNGECQEFKMELGRSQFHQLQQRVISGEFGADGEKMRYNINFLSNSRFLIVSYLKVHLGGWPRHRALARPDSRDSPNPRNRI